MRIFLSKIIDWFLVAFLFLLPWQTRWIWHQGEINGAPWEYGTYSLYGTEILLWLIIILFAINKFRHKEFWKKIISSEHYQARKKYLFFALGFIIFLAVSVLHSKNIWLSYNYIFYLLGALCLFVILSEAEDLHLSFPPPIGVEGRLRRESRAMDLGSWPGMTVGEDPSLSLRSCPERSERMTVAFWLGGVAQGLLALWQFLTQFVYGNKWLGMAAQDPKNLGTAVIEFGDERWLRAYGSFGWPNSLGIYLAVCLVIGVILYLKLSFRFRCLPLVPAHLEREGGMEAQHPTPPFPHRGEDKWRILIAAGQIVITVGLVLSFSRSAWLAAVCGLLGVLVIVMLSFRALTVPSGRNLLASGFKGFLHSLRSVEMTGLIKQIFFIILPAVCLFFIFQPVFLARFNPQNRLENRSLTERQGQYAEFKQIFFTHPWLGVGPGAYTLALSEIYPQAKAYDLQPVHNIYLLTLAEWGIIGSIIWLSVYGFMGLKVWKNNKIFLPVILVLLAAGFFDHWTLTLYPGIMLWWIGWGFLMRRPA